MHRHRTSIASRLPNDFAHPAEMRLATAARHMRTIRSPLDWNLAAGLWAPLSRPRHLPEAFEVLVSPHGPVGFGLCILSPCLSHASEVFTVTAPRSLADEAVDLFATRTVPFWF